MADKKLQMGTRVRVQIPTEVLTLNEGMHRRVVRLRDEKDGRKLVGTITGLPDDQRPLEVAGITATTIKEGTQRLFYDSYTVRLDRKEGRSSRLVNVPAEQLEAI